MILTVDVLAILYNASLFLNNGRFPLLFRCAVLSVEDTSFMPTVEELIAPQSYQLQLYV